MIATLRRAAKRILPGSVVNWIRDQRKSQVDEVAMIAALCTGRGVMIDVGAHYGQCTSRFLAKGWRVVAYEPDPANRAVFQREVGQHPRLELSTNAVSNEEQRQIAFYTSDVSTGISGLSAFHNSHLPTDTVDTVTLTADLRRRGVDKVDVLKIDIEGFDFFALQGFDWDLKPRFVVYEFEERKTLPLGYALNDSVSYMSERGYHLLFSVWEPIEEYGVNHTWRGLYREVPADAAKCWGNVLAFINRDDLEECLRRFG